MPSAYERRVTKRHDYYQIRRDRDREAILEDANRLCEEYERVYEKCYDRSIKVTYVKGWFRTRSRKYRRDDFQKQIQFMYAKMHAAELGGNEDGQNS